MTTLRLRRTAGPIALVAAMAVLAPSLARGDADVIKQAERLNKKALEDYDSLEFDSARQTLLGVVAKLRDSGDDETPIAAVTYVNLGVVYIAGFKDRNRGVQQFVNALKIDPNATLDPERATPELQDAFAEAQKQVPKSGAGDHGTKPPPQQPPDQTSGLLHNPVDEAKVNQRVLVQTKLSDDLAGKAQRVYLFYRAGGQEDFVSVPMEAEGGVYAAEIPGDAVTGRTVQYYLEARDKSGRPLVASGSAASPYIIAVAGGGQAGDKENPLDHGGEAPPVAPKSRGFGRIYLGLMAGTGIGVEPQGNTTEVAYRFDADAFNGGGGYVPQPVGATGVTLAPFHLAVEAAINITKMISIGAVGRFQVVTGANADSAAIPANSMGPTATGLGTTAKAPAAIAGLLRLKFRFLSGKVHPFVHIDVGGGYIRHALDLSGPNSDPNSPPLTDAQSAAWYNQGNKGSFRGNVICPLTSCTDTIAMGFVLFGAGGGISYDFLEFTNGGLGLVLDVTALGSAGDQSAFNLDIQGGVQVHAF